MGEAPKPTKTPRSILSYLFVTLIIGIGIIVQRYFQLLVHAQPPFNAKMFEKFGAMKWVYGKEKALTAGDVLTLVVGVLIAIFGGKLHKYVRWFGLGWCTGIVTFEVKEALGLMGT